MIKIFPIKTDKQNFHTRNVSILFSETGYPVRRLEQNENDKNPDTGSLKTYM